MPEEPAQRSWSNADRTHDGASAQHAAGVGSERLQSVARTIEQAVRGTLRNERQGRQPAAPFANESEAAYAMFDAVRTSTGNRMFSKPSLNAELADWAQAVPELVRSLSQPGRLAPAEVELVRQAAPRVRAALEVMGRDCAHGHYRKGLVMASLELPAAAVRENAPVREADIDRLGDAMMAVLRWADGVPRDFRQAGLDAIVDAHRFGLINAGQRDSLRSHFDERVRSDERSEAEVAEHRRRQGADPHGGPLSMLVDAGPAATARNADILRDSGRNRNSVNSTQSTHSAGNVRSGRRGLAAWFDCLRTPDRPRPS